MPEWQIQGNFLWQREFRDGVRTGSNFLTNAHSLMAPDILRRRAGVATIMGQMAVPILQLGPNYTFGLVESLYDQHETENAYTASLALNGLVQVGAIEHRLITGIDFYHQSLHQQFAVEERQFTRRQVFSEAILRNPQRTLLEAMLREAPATRAINLQSKEVTRVDWGSYFQVRSNWTPDWSTSMGWRYSRFYEWRREIGGSNPDLEGNYDDRLVQVGSSWLLTDAISLYSNYSETLNLNYLIDDFDRFVEQPEKSHQHELGLKWQGSDGRKFGAVSLFDITSSGINTVEFESGYRTLQAPKKHRVRGIEIDLNWRVNDRFEWIASGALLHNELSEQNSAIGYPSMVADNTLGIFGRIRLSDSWASYTGISYVSDRSIDRTGNAKLGAYTLVDLTLEKNLMTNTEEWRIRAMVKNLLDEYHPSAALPGTRVVPTPGRHVFIKLSYEFQK